MNQLLETKWTVEDALQFLDKVKAQCDVREKYEQFLDIFKAFKLKSQS